MKKGTRVEFKTTDGVTLRADYYRADGENRPIVVMTPGLTLLKEHFMPAFAERYNAAGISGLAFDYRGWGSSDGLPRQGASLLQQAEDYRDAVSAAMRLPGVDPGKVVVMGLGHGAAAALIAAADDPRIAAVILQSPIVSGKKDSGLYPSGWREKAWRDRENRTRTGKMEPTYIQVWPETAAAPREDAQVLFRNEMAHTFITEALLASNAAGTPWENQITMDSLLAIAGTEAGDYIRKITQPTLYVVFPGDPFTGTAEFHKASFDKMGANGEFRIVEPPTNSNTEGFILSTADSHIDFLKRVL